MRTLSVDSDCLSCDSPVDTAFVAIPASMVDFNNESPSSPVPSTFTDHPSSASITLDSFVPILKHLPGFYLDENGRYMIRGSLKTTDWARLQDYAGTVSRFILTDENSEAPISPAAFLRLARLQHPDLPLLPSLRDLVIVDADACLTHLDLLLTPSLKTLEASCIPDAQQSTFFSFLTAVNQEAQEAPLLETLILGPGRFSSRSLQVISQFNNLRHFELKHEDSKLPFAFFDNIGSLPKLETLVLDARHISSTIITEDKHNEDDTADAPTISPSAFNQLAKLHVIGWLPVLEDLIRRITSTKLEDISITFIRLSHYELKVKEKAERERKAEETRRRAEEKMAQLKDEMERMRMDEERRREEQEQKKKDEEQLLKDIAGQNPMKDNSVCFDFSPPLPSSSRETVCFHYPRPVSPSPPPSGFWDFATVAEPQSSTGGKKKKGRKADLQRAEPVEVDGWLPVEETKPPAIEVPYPTPPTPSEKTQDQPKMQEAREAPEILLTEQEQLSFDAHTLSFTKLLRELCCRWMASLKTVTICQIGGSFQCLLQPPTFPEEMFRKMFLLPNIESLEVEGWILDSVEGVLSTEAESIPNLKSLLLPLAVGGANFGISLSTLRNVAKICPTLESFQCHIHSLSQIPEYPIPTDAGLSHRLRELTIGNSLPLPDTKGLYLIARHLYLLFPNLETINTSEGHNAGQWVIVEGFLKMFQTARMDDLNRQ